MANENGIEVRGLVREYKKGPRAVDGIDISVAPGEIYGFLGPNGAGKSTTIHVLTTLLPPTAGTALVGGYDVVKDGPKIRGLIGVAQEEGRDFRIDGRTLVFDRELRTEGKLGFWRWLSLWVGIAGTYRQNDSVDVVYDRAGTRVVATGLRMVDG